MPTYAYACTACDHRFEAQQAFTDDALTECPECRGRLRKLYNAVGIVFKGSGFYRTDSRAGSGSSGTEPKESPKESKEGKESKETKTAGTGSKDSSSSGSPAPSGSPASSSSGSSSSGSSSSGGGGDRSTSAA